MKKESRRFSDFPIKKIPQEEFKNHPLLKNLLEISQCPKELFYRGNLESFTEHTLAIVGSRAITQYGKDALEKIFENLESAPITIISGLALGVDGEAHKQALKKKLPIIAIPGSGLGEKVLYPKTNKELALEILCEGGLLLSEFPEDFPPAPWTFPARNRIMAALAQKILLVEASLKSGTLITARLALDYNKDVLCIPGSIFSSRSEGTNILLRDGATPVLESDDILKEFRLKTKEKQANKNFEDLTPNELKILNELDNPEEKDILMQKIKMEVTDFLMALTMLEMKNLININGSIVSIKK